MKTSNGCAAGGLAAKITRNGILLLVVCATAVGLTSCVDYHGRPYGGGYYSAGYAAPYYGYPYYGGPYYGGYPYGYGGAAVVISSGGHGGYRHPYYNHGYYPRQRIQSGNYSTRHGAVVPPPRAIGPRTRATNPRTQATVPH